MCLFCASLREEPGAEDLVTSLHGGIVLDTLVDRPLNSTSRGAGPCKALGRVRLDIMSDAERVNWQETARVDAILRPCRLSMRSVKSGIRCWIGFIGEF